MSKKVVLSVLMLFGAMACIGLSITLLVRSFTESSSLFMTTSEVVQGSDEFSQYLSLISMGLGVGILVFLRKYWGRGI